MLQSFSRLAKTVAVSIALAASLSACSSPETNFRDVDSVGQFRDWKVEFANDRSSSKGYGIYVFTRTSSGASGSSEDLGEPRLVGTVAGERLFFVRDTSFSSRGKGFYAVEGPDGLEPIPTASFKFGGKNAVFKSVGFHSRQGA